MRHERLDSVSFRENSQKISCCDFTTSPARSRLTQKNSCQNTEIARKIRSFIASTTFFAILTQRCIITHHGPPVCCAQHPAVGYTGQVEDRGLTDPVPAAT
jgi:hypothetical protein